jgi:REP element-mobilizing transposase RayT
MPRQSRIDGAGAIHHIIVRGIEKRNLFKDDEDRDFFVRRLALILQETKTSCYAWALIPNHFHLLLRTGSTAISTVMRRLLTGYAQYYNRRHKRHGHLFQNRYKSILCEEEEYLLELVRYIHLNPLRSRLVTAMPELDAYPYCGHSAIMNVKPSFADIDFILQQFDKRTRTARKLYREFVECGIGKGRRTDLTGGGLIRSSGGWEALLSERSKGFKSKGDERILGGGDFVERILQESDEALNNRLRLRLSGYDINRLADRVKEILGINPLESPGRYHHVVKARRIFCYWGVRELGIPGTDLGKRLGISQPAVSKAVKEGEIIIKKENLSLQK